jgi:hypothetical protein
MKYCLDVAHHLQGEIDGENAGVLPLVFLEDVGLNRAAHVGQHLGAEAAYFHRPDRAAVFGAESIHLLIDGGVEKHGQHDGGRPVDGHGDRRVGAHRSKPS